MNNKKCLVLANNDATRVRLEGWLARENLESVVIKSDEALCTHPLLAVCPMVLLHVTTPERLETIRQLRNNPETALLPIVCFAANDMWRQDCYDAGADAAFIRFTLESEINARIRALATRRRFFRQWAEQRVQAAEQGQERIRQVFRRYVSPQLVDQILDRLAGDLSQVEQGTRTHAAVLFADMRGFTGIAEQLQPGQVFELLNEFFTTLTAAAFAQQGTVFNMAGDSLMVGFGVPVQQDDAGRRALRAARAMLAGFQGLATGWRKRFGVETGLGIGINQGDVMAGNIGSEQYMNYTLIGDTVNVAARLGQRARAGEVLFSNALKLSLDARDDNDVPVLALPPLTVRGRVNPIDIYCVPTEQRLDIRAL